MDLSNEQIMWLKKVKAGMTEEELATAVKDDVFLSLDRDSHLIRVAYHPEFNNGWNSMVEIPKKVSLTAEGISTLDVELEAKKTDVRNHLWYPIIVGFITYLLGVITGAIFL
ncbi:hypothetical protein ACFQ5J_05355 [Lacticaseibacillus baoqingensis]|uniref:TMhelix containing protein n=1 Tax=Lacticaseibacillus baoqingensis TaxID=2486013 RepID=A0ABW4E667_9LACO|nr:hypothetical protein [Lacticaseibacillus baoqingensis]